MSAQIIIEGPLEEPGGDDFSGVAIPFEAIRTPEGTVIHACAELESVARAFAFRFTGEETSAEAELWLRGAAEPVFAGAGLMSTDDCGRLYIFRFDVQSGCSARTIDVEAVEFNRGARYENLTTFELERYADFELPVYIVLEDDKIVSASVAVPCDYVGGTAEISVETAQGYRGRGYATACTSALARGLRDRGIDAIYIAQADNAVSVSTARGAGFIEYGSVLQLVCAER